MTDQSQELRYEFGKNWSQYVARHFSEERLAQSRAYLLQFLGLESLDGRTFLDIGCGSGLQSLSAIQSGAARVISFDYDPDSVATARVLREHAGSPDNWTVQQGSALDRDYMESLGKADIVHSWGVLHHTGDVWTAFENACSCIAEGGLFYVALYSANKYQNPSPAYWLEKKQRYVRAGPLERRWMEVEYVWQHQLNGSIKAVPQLVRKIRGHDEKRGMTWYTKVKDWLGGWPMEFCWDEDVTKRALELGLEQVRIKTGGGNTEFLFARPTQDRG